MRMGRMDGEWRGSRLEMVDMDRLGGGGLEIDREWKWLWIMGMALDRRDLNGMDGVDRMQIGQGCR